MASSDSYFHFVHEAVTILMDTAILYYKVLPWFWKVKTNPLLQSISLCKYFGWSFLSSEIWRISYKGWFECWEWDNTHPCILSWCHGLVTGTNEITTVLVLYIVSCDLMRLIFFRNEEIPVLSYIILNFNGISQN